MLIAIIGSSRDYCVEMLVRELQKRNLGDVLVVGAQSVSTSSISLSGNEETALVYSVETLTHEPLTAEDCRKLLKPLAKHICAQKHPGSGAEVPMPPRHSRQRPCPFRKNLHASHTPQEQLGFPTVSLKR